MRLLPDVQRKALLSEICTYAQKTTKFQLPDCDLHIQVIPGETEGLYGWIAANYLLGGFDEPEEHNHGKGHHTYGFLDMGGASAQIAFAPNVTEADKHANDLKLLRMRTIDGKAAEYRVFVTTWLGFGANEARRRYVEALMEAVGPDVLELPDPCLPAGAKLTKTGKAILPGSGADKEQHLVGTGRFAECLRSTYPLLEKDKPCKDDPCLLNGVHVPSIDFDVNHFVGVSEYWHTTHEIFSLDGHKEKDHYDFHEYQNKVQEFCTTSWDRIEKDVGKGKWGKKVDQQKALEVCFKASWVINILHDGIGIPRKGLEDPDQDHDMGYNASSTKLGAKGFLDPFQAVNKINDVEVSWTLGKMVLYASSQVPPSDPDSPIDTTLPVGFGTNDGHVNPFDFQPAGGSPASLPNDLTDTSDAADGGDWHDTLFSSNFDSPRRIPGLLLFMLILCFAAFLLRRRIAPFLPSRLSSFFSRWRRGSSGAIRLAGLSSPKKRRGWTGKFFPSKAASSPSYDRVPNAELGDPADFELGEFHSDSDHDAGSIDSAGSSGARGRGRTSGWSTPQLRVEQAAVSHDATLPAKTSTSLDGAGLGLSPSNAVFGSAMDFRGGGSLIPRVESRDRLNLSPVLSRSRNSSPSRRSPRIGVLKEQVD